VLAVKKRIYVWIAMALLLGTILGCGQSEKDRGRNSLLDRPAPTHSSGKS
jgi:hypothetical protein